jgi:hypothetical protein
MGSSAVKPPPDARPAQVRLILESRTFRNTEVLKRLLEYLARQALENKGELKEYTVAVEAFGKSADYDPQTDSSVRVQAGKLRQKLDEYYRTEAADDEYVIELPKGHFKLEFRPRSTEVLPASKLARRRVWFAAAGALVLVMAGAFLLQTRSRLATGAATWNTEMEELWKPFLSSSRPLLVIIGTPLFTKIGGSFFRAPAVTVGSPLPNRRKWPVSGTH